MIRIAGISLPDKKRIIIALTYIFGIGKSKARTILKKLNINKDKKVAELTQTETKKLRDEIETKHKVEGELRQKIKDNIKILKETNSYRGIRHKKNLPTRGQRTKTNSRTVRGNVRHTTVSGKTKIEKT